jgi:copper homeostasis protein CutC
MRHALRRRMAFLTCFNESYTEDCAIMCADIAKKKYSKRQNVVIGIHDIHQSLTAGLFYSTVDFSR